MGSLMMMKPEPLRGAPIYLMCRPGYDWCAQGAEGGRCIDPTMECEGGRDQCKMHCWNEKIGNHGEKMDNCECEHSPAGTGTVSENAQVQAMKFMQQQHQQQFHG